MLINTIISVNNLVSLASNTSSLSLIYDNLRILKNNNKKRNKILKKYFHLKLLFVSRHLFLIILDSSPDRSNKVFNLNKAKTTPLKLNLFK